MSNSWGQGRGRLSCLWAVYHEPWDPRPTNISDSEKNVNFIGDADTGESFLGLVAQAMVTNPSGTIFLFRKHIRPHWEDLRTGCHLSVTPTQSEVQSHPKFLDIFFKVVDEQIKMAPFIAGIGLWRDQNRYLFTVWLINEEESSVQVIRRELAQMFPPDAVIGLVSHKHMSFELAEQSRGKRGLAPFLDLHTTAQLISEPLPLLATMLQQAPIAMVNEQPQPQQQYFYDNGHSQSFGHPQQIANNNSAVSFTMETLARHSDSSFNIPRPTPALDWTMGWTPTAFHQVPKEADRSDSSKGTSATSATDSSRTNVATTTVSQPANMFAPTAPITVVYSVPQSQPQTIYYQNTPQPQQMMQQPQFVNIYDPSSPPPYTGGNQPSNYVLLPPQVPSFAPQSYTTPLPLLPPPPVYTHNGPMMQHHQQHQQQHQFHPQQSYPQHHHQHHHHQMRERPAPARPNHLQSDRKPFVFQGQVYPPGLNRKEYRTVVHHSDESGPHPAAFPAPEGTADGELEMSEYYKLKEDMAASAKPKTAPASAPAASDVQPSPQSSPQPAPQAIAELTV